MDLPVVIIIIKVTGELCVSLYPSASVRFAVELGNINSPLSLPLLPIVTNFQFKPLSSVVGGITDHKHMVLLF